MPETKKKVVPLSERETIITYNDAEKTANVYTMNRKLSRKLLAGKASALLNASGIGSNNCIDGHCSGCGECCADLLPLTKGEIKRLRDYARKHHLQENKRSFLETKGGPDLSCPFRNEHTKQCDVYSVRPLICKEYICSRLLQKPIAQTGLTKEKRDIHSLRWEVFKNPECENLLKEAQKAAMKRR